MSILHGGFYLPTARTVVVCNGADVIAPGSPLPHAGFLYNSNANAPARLEPVTQIAAVGDLQVLRQE